MLGSSSAPRAAFFDFDKTIIDRSSATLWFMYELRGGRLPFWYAIRVPFWTLQYSLGLGTMDAVFAGASAIMQGQEVAPIAARVREWFDAQVRDRVRPGALEAIRRHRDSGDLVVVATSSTQYVAKLACEAYNLDDAISTRLEVRDGRLTGRVESNANGPEKAARAAEWAAARGIALEDCTFYSDSITDLALLERVGHPVAVNPDRRLGQLARERGWPVVDWGLSARTAAARARR